MTRRSKTLLLGLGIFAAIVAGVLVVYMLRKPATTPTTSPTPRPVATPVPSAVVPEVNVVESSQTAACELRFTVTTTTTPGLVCDTKDLYKDVAGNAAGSYALTAANKLAADFTVVPGTTYIYAISYKNTGTGATAGTVEDTLPAGITYKDSSDGCTYVSATRKVTCTLSSVAAGASGKVGIRFTVNENITAGSLDNSAKVIPTTGAQSTCSLTNPVKPSGSPSGSPSSSPSGSPQSSSSPSPSASTPGSASLECIVKRAYEDSSNNTPGQYYLNNEIVDTNTLQNGQTIVYNVLIGNDGNAAVSDTTITDVLSSNLTFVDGESGCTYESSTRTVTCVVGSLAANTETSRSFRARISTAGTSAIANTADVSSTNGQRDSCSITVNATGEVVTPPSPAPSSLPEAGIFEVTAGTLGLGVLLLIAGALGLLLL